VATELSRDELRKLARLGAERRLEELKREEIAIRAAFPELGRVAAGARADVRSVRGRRQAGGAL
jgi:hypothetical protein